MSFFCLHFLFFLDFLDAALVLINFCLQLNLDLLQLWVEFSVKVGERLVELVLALILEVDLDVGNFVHVLGDFVEGLLHLFNVLLCLSKKSGVLLTSLDQLWNQA